MQTGGRNLSEARLSAAIEAGLQGIGVSIDGLAPLHDALRGVPGSFDKAIKALRSARAHKIPAGVNTQIGARTMPELPSLMSAIIDAGATHWQIQLTVAMGNAVDNDDVPALAVEREGERRAYPSAADDDDLHPAAL